MFSVENVEKRHLHLQQRHKVQHEECIKLQAAASVVNSSVRKETIDYAKDCWKSLNDAFTQFA